MKARCRKISMPYPWSINPIATESDVEQKLIHPLLTNEMGLGYFTEEVKTKQYLVPRELDKGAGRKRGYYPDYLVYLKGFPVCVLEAKGPHENVAGGFREAQLYALELNKAFPSGLNPVQLIVATNGVTLAYGRWDSDSYVEFSCRDLVPGLAQFEQLKAHCGRMTALALASAIHRELSPNSKSRPIRLKGGPAFQNRELPANRFAKDLVPLLRKYFDPEAVRSHPEIVRRAYCSTSQITHYDAQLESLLKDNLSKKRHPDFEPVETTRKEAGRFGAALQKVVKDKLPGNEAVVLLIGGVGAGKSMFVDRYYLELMDEVVRDSTLWSFVDFNLAPGDLEGLGNWIVDQVLEDFPKRNGIEDFMGTEALKHYFAPDIRSRPYKDLELVNAAEVARLRTADLVAWSDDKKKLLKGVLRYYGGDVGKRIVVVFDNADRRDAEQQLRVFQAVQHFRSEYKSFCILSLRDVTYDRFQREPPLDAFFKPFAFRIQPPRFLDVIKKRLDLVIEDLTREADKRLEYTLPNGVVIQYPATDLGKYLLGVYTALFSPQRRVRVILEALSNSNIRHALQMFCEILISGHMTEDRLFAASHGAGHVVMPEWLILRILMRTKYQFFAESHGYVCNLFDCNDDSSSMSNFVMSAILHVLARDRKRRGELDIEGFRHVAALADELSAMGIGAEDGMWGLRHLLERRLIVADHQRSNTIERNDYVKITASGWVHYGTLLQRREYLLGIAPDVPLLDRVMAGTITDNLPGIHDEYDSNRVLQERRLSAFRNAIQAEGHRFKSLAIDTALADVVVQEVGEHIDAGLGLQYPSGLGDL